MSFANRISLLIAGAVFGLGAHSATAQTSEPVSIHTFCILLVSEELDGQLMAVCDGKAFVLGLADIYEVVENSSLEATIIDLARAGERRVLMISSPAGEPLLEDISGTLAKSAGRGPMSRLDDVTIDFSSFAEDGTIRTASADAGGVTGEVDMELQIAAEASRSGELGQN